MVSGLVLFKPLTKVFQLYIFLTFSSWPTFLAGVVSCMAFYGPNKKVKKRVPTEIRNFPRQQLFQFNQCKEDSPRPSWSWFKLTAFWYKTQIPNLLLQLICLVSVRSFGLTVSRRSHHLLATVKVFFTIADNMMEMTVEGMTLVKFLRHRNSILLKLFSRPDQISISTNTFSIKHICFQMNVILIVGGLKSDTHISFVRATVSKRVKVIFLAKS